MAEIRLLVAGTEYAGWQSVTVDRSLDAISGAFSLQVSDRWAGQSTPWPIRPGDECTLAVDGDVVITGFVDVINPRFDKASRSLVVQGRDKAADMVDSSATNNPDNWTDYTIGQLAAELAKPFGITVADRSGDNQKFRLAKIQPGETAHEILERYARQRGVLAVSDGVGGINLIKPGTARALVSLEQGKNILAASGVADHSARFSQYLVTGQTFGNDQLFGDAAAQIEGEARDAEIRAIRKLVIIAANAGIGADLVAAAQWEATVRAARGSKLSVTVQGWRQTIGGPIWNPGELVEVKSDWLQLTAPTDFMINAVRFTKSNESGTLTELELMRPDAYRPQPVVEESDPLMDE